MSIHKGASARSAEGKPSAVIPAGRGVAPQFAPVREAPYDPGMRVRALVLATVLGAASSAFAQPAVHKEGEYTGVVPGKVPEASGGKPDKKRAIAKGTLSWLGFSAKDGGAEVFFQSPTKFEVNQRMEGQVLVVQLAGLTRQVTNTRRPVDTRFFDNPLARITAQPRRAGKRGRAIEVRVVFKNPKDARQATVRTNTEADGLFYAYLSFPEGADSAEVPSEGEMRPAGDIAESLDGDPGAVTAPSESAGDDELPAAPAAKKKTAKPKK